MNIKKENGETTRSSWRRLQCHFTYRWIMVMGIFSRLEFFPSEIMAKWVRFSKRLSLISVTSLQNLFLQLTEYFKWKLMKCWYYKMHSVICVNWCTLGKVQYSWGLKLSSEKNEHKRCNNILDCYNVIVQSKWKNFSFLIRKREMHDDEVK